MTSNRGLVGSLRLCGSWRLSAKRVVQSVFRAKTQRPAKTYLAPQGRTPLVARAPIRALAPARFALRDLQPAVTSDTVPIREQRYEIKSDRDHCNYADDQFFFLRR